MDKAWMSKYRFSREYLEGVKDFLKFALQNSTNPKQIRCPCANCKNLLKTNCSTIKLHLEANGVDRTYHTWIFHGEKEEVSTTVLERDETLETNRVSIEKEEDPVTMVDDAYNICQDNPTQFRDLLEDAEKPLYPSNMKFTKLSALVKLYNLKAKYGRSDISFTALLSLLGEMLPEGNELPLSLYSAKKTLRAVGLTYQKIRACPNKALVMFNAKRGRRGKKKPYWEIVKGPIQPDDKQCGFFVMRFMKEIIDEIVIGGTISLKSHFENRTYSQKDIDEVRYARADFVVEQI